MAPDALGQLEAWFLCGSQHMYGAEQLRAVEAHAAEIAAALDAADEIPVRVVGKPVVTTPESIRAVMVEANESRACIGVIAWMHTFSPAKMWIAGLVALRQAAAPPPHAVQPRSALGRDRHGLHEPQPVGPRRPRVRLHRDPDGPRAQDRRRPLDGSGRARADRRLGAGRVRLARGATAHGRPVRRQHAPGRGDRGRQGRGADPARRHRVNGYGVGDLVDVGRRGAGGRGRRLVDEYEASLRRSFPSCARTGERRESLRDAARIEAGLRGVPRRGGRPGVHRHVRGPRRPARSCPGSPSSG